MKLSDKVYTVLCMLFVSLIIVLNMTSRKVVVLTIPFFYKFEISLGVVLFPLSVLITDLITEFFDKDRVKFCVRMAVVIYIFVSMIVVCMRNLHATSWSEVDDFTFYRVFGFYHIVVIGSVTACYVSQMVDVFIYLFIRNITKGKFLWLRSSFSTAISLFVDTVIIVFCVVISGMQPSDSFWTLIKSAYYWKLFFTLFNIPLFYMLVGITRMILKRKKSEN